MKDIQDLKYSGVKFKTIFIEKREIKHAGIEELSIWGKKFVELGLAPKIVGGFAGNLSFRTSNGFIITASGANLSELKSDDFVEVKTADINLKQIFVCGLKNASSESFLHHAIYIKLPEINAVFHGHDELTLKYNNLLNIPITEKEQPYGSIELVNEAVKILDNYILNNHKKSNYFLLKNHGFISFGKTMNEAGSNAVSQHSLAIKLKF